MEILQTEENEETKDEEVPAQRAISWRGGMGQVTTKAMTKETEVPSPPTLEERMVPRRKANKKKRKT